MIAQPRIVAALVTVGLLTWVQSPVGAADVSATVDGVRVELTSQPQRPGTGGETTYTLRLLDAGGKPVTGARVTLQGRMADGMTVLAPLRRAAEPGMYRGRVMFTMQGLWNLIVRVVRKNQRFELPLSEQVDR